MKEETMKEEINLSASEQRRYGTDSLALACRRGVNEQFAQADFDGWVFDSLQLRQGLNVLDVGCGDGKHLFKSAELVSPGGRVVGVDISEESLRRCAEKIKRRQIKNIQLHNCDLTQVKETFPPPTKFDRILSSFAVYYTSDAEKTFGECYELLTREGVLFFCGPTKRSNQEFLRLAQSAGCRKRYSQWAGFLQDKGRNLLERIAGNVEVISFENPVAYPDAETLYNYWKSTQLYDQSLETPMKEAIEKEFKKSSKFINTKVTMGLRCTKS